MPTVLRVSTSIPSPVPSRCCRFRSRPNGPSLLLLASQPTPIDNGAEAIPSPQRTPIWVKPAGLDRPSLSSPPTPHAQSPSCLSQSGRKMREGPKSR